MWTTIVGAACSIVVLLLQAYMDNAPQRKKEAEEADDEQLRKDCADLNADAVSQRIDQLLSPNDGPAGIPNPDTEKGATGS